MDFSSPDTWRWIFLVVGVGFTLGEIAVAGTFFLLPFAAGALGAAVGAFLGWPVAVDWLIFVVLSAGASAVLWPLRKRLDSRTPQSSIGANRWVGREALVLREIPGAIGETGLVRLDREEWRAESMVGVPIAAGSKVLVSRVDGTRLVVLPLEDPPLEQPSSLPPADSGRG